MTVTWTKEITNLSTNTDVFSSGVWCARQSLRWYSAIRELWIYTTNCSTTLEAVLVCQGIHRVYLRVSNSKFTHQIPAGSERGIIGHWINNHCSCPPWGSSAASLCTLVPAQHPGALTKPHVLLPFQPCPALPSTALAWAEIAQVVSQAAKLHLPTREGVFPCLTLG